MTQDHAARQAATHSTAKSTRVPGGKAAVPKRIQADYDSDDGSIKAKDKVDNNGSTNDSVPPTAPALAAQQGQRMESAMGDAILRFLRIRKPRKDDVYDLDAVRNLNNHGMPKILTRTRSLRSQVFGTRQTSSDTKNSTSTHSGKIGQLLIPTFAGPGVKRMKYDAKLTGRLW